MLCDMCGNKEAVYNTEIEGSLLSTCESCAAHGNVKSRIRVEQEAPKKKGFSPKQATERAEQEIVEIIVGNCASLIKSAREKKGLKQEDLAKILHEKESVIHNIESGRMQPSISLARKLEKYFKIKIVEEYTEKAKPKTSSQGLGSLTLGDIANIKKRDK